MRKNMKKKGALELSVNSIVIMVIAFVVLGLILTFTRTIFKFGQEKTTSIFEATTLDTPPDAENPITLADTVNIKANGKKTLNVGYYNRNPYSAENAKFGIYSCQDENGNDILTSGEYEEGVMPTITSAYQNIDASDSNGYKIIINENGLTSGQLYICTVVIYDGVSVDEPTEINPDELNQRTQDSPVYETKQIFLEIAA